MATSDKAAWEVMQSHLAKMGYGTITMIGDPRSDAQSRMIAIVPRDGEVDRTTLGTPSEIHRVVLRFYVNWFEEPQEDTEFLLDQFRADIMEDVFGDYELGGTVCSALPTEFAWEYGIATVEKTLYRTLDLTVGYRIEDRAAFSP